MSDGCLNLKPHGFRGCCPTQALRAICCNKMARMQPSSCGLHKLHALHHPPTFQPPAIWLSGCALADASRGELCLELVPPGLLPKLRRMVGLMIAAQYAPAQQGYIALRERALQQVRLACHGAGICMQARWCVAAVLRSACASCTDLVVMAALPPVLLLR